MKLRFSIRDLLWLTALCAVLVAWWIDRTSQATRHQNEMHALVSQFEEREDQLVQALYGRLNAKGR